MSGKKHYTGQELGENGIISAKMIFVRDILQHGREHQAEIDLSVKMYVDSHTRKRRSNLSGAGAKLLLWCMSECNERTDHLHINVKMYMQENEIASLNTYKKSLLELIEANFLAETKIKDVFYFDHTAFFKGSRVNALNLNVIKPYL